MINNFNSKYFIIFAICFSLLFGVILRLYNLNYDNLWFDEIASFWVSDPFISLSESYERNRLAESQPSCTPCHLPESRHWALPS